MGLDQTVHEGKLCASLQVGNVLPGHASDGGPRPKPDVGARNKLLGFRQKHRRVRYRAQRPRARGLLLRSRDGHKVISHGYFIQHAEVTPSFNHRILRKASIHLLGPYTRLKRTNIL